MKLYAKVIGEGPPIVILHGLFGMSDNWMSIGKALAGKGYSSHLLDLRNHGRSPHTATHRYPDMCDDLLGYIQKSKNMGDRVILMGHSMGGKLGMIFALLYPEMVDKLVVVDIAPVDYRSRTTTFHRDLVETLLQIDLTVHHQRTTIRQELEARLHDPRLALFLAKNITKDDKRENYRWKFNLPVLQKNIQHLYIGLEELEIHAPCPVKTLFVKGNLSDYILPRHERDRHFFFPDSEVVGIDGAGHWVHSEQPAVFLHAVSAFLA